MTNVLSNTMNTHTKDAPVAILGFGVAGFNAAVGLRCGGYAGAIDVFSSIDTIPYSPIMTSYYASGQASYDQCFPWAADEVDRLDLTIHHSCPVKHLSTATHLIQTDEGDFPYSKCIIATGASPVVYGFESGGDYFPFTLHSMEDAELLRAALDDPTCKKVLISGASMVAIKMLEAALVKDKECTLVGMNGQILDMTAFPEAATRFEKNLREQGVQFRFNQTIAETIVHENIEHEGHRKLEVIFSNGESDIFDEIFAAHGFKSDLSYLEEAGIELAQGILVDDHMRTSNEDVFAAGDVAQALELVSGTPQLVGIWKNAALQGMCAGRAAAADLLQRELSTDQTFQGSIASNTISCNGPLFISAGSSHPTETSRLEIVEDGEMTIVHLYEDDRLIGFNISADRDIEGGRAYDLGGMLTRRILSDCAVS